MRNLKGYEEKGDRKIMRFWCCETGYESCTNLLDALESPWHRARYWYQIRRYRNHITISYGKIKRPKEWLSKAVRG